MKKSIFLFSILLTLVLISTVAADIPNYYDKYVDDFAKFLNADETNALRTMLYQTDQNTTAEVVVVIVNDTGSYALSEYAVKIFDEWKVGKADKDNGLVILYSVSDKKIWVSTGYGLEGILPDSKLGRMLDDYYVPLRDQGQTKEGIINFTEEVVKVLNANRDEIISGQAGGSSGGISVEDILFWAFFAYIILGGILGQIYKGKKKKNLPWFIPIFFPIRSSGPGTFSGGGGFGGGGFGGGGGGGGGAGR